jgi:hypothetical protein
MKPEEGRVATFVDLLIVLDASDWVNKLRLPATFARKCTGEMPGGVALYHTNGVRYWNVNTERRGHDDLLLTVGWRHFVVENALLCGSRLRLRYRGNGNFWVSVWDRNGRRVTVAPQLLTR